MAPQQERRARAADDAEVHASRITATALREADVPFPPFFIPFSNAPPR